MVESWTRGLSSLKEGSQLCRECEIKKQRVVLSPRTGLNGDERGQEQVRQAKKQRRRLRSSQPKWWRSGSANLFGPCLLPLPLPLWPPLSLPLFLPFFPRISKFPQVPAYFSLKPLILLGRTELCKTATK